MIQSFDIGGNASTAVRQIAYETDTESLYVEYAAGNVYRYTGVGVEAIDGLLDVIESGHSIGRFINMNVKDCYPFVYVGDTHDVHFSDVCSAFVA